MEESFEARGFTQGEWELTITFSRFDDMDFGNSNNESVTTTFHVE